VTDNDIYAYGPEVPNCLMKSLGGTDRPTCGTGNYPSTGTGKFLGWALDGFPIFGQYDACQASVTGLDSCGGKSITAWDGYTYAYFMTQSSGIKCFRGNGCCSGFGAVKTGGCGVVSTTACSTTNIGKIEYEDTQDDYDDACFLYTPDTTLPNKIYSDSSCSDLMASLPESPVNNCLRTEAELSVKGTCIGSKVSLVSYASSDCTGNGATIAEVELNGDDTACQGFGSSLFFKGSLKCTDDSGASATTASTLLLACLLCAATFFANYF